MDPPKTLSYLPLKTCWKIKTHSFIYFNFLFFIFFIYKKKKNQFLSSEIGKRKNREKAKIVFHYLRLSKPNPEFDYFKALFSLT